MRVNVESEDVVLECTLRQIKDLEDPSYGFSKYRYLQAEELRLNLHKNFDASAIAKAKKRVGIL